MSGLDFMIPSGMQRVLAPLLMHPERSLSLSDLIRTSGGGRGGTQRVVQTLSDAGVVTERRVGNQGHLAIDTRHPLYPELRSMAMKTFGLVDVIRAALSPMSTEIETAFVFGSMAGGTAKPDSDVDLLVVGTPDYLEINHALASAERDLGRQIHLNLVDEEEWAAWRTTSVGASILSGTRMMVVGDEP